MLKILGSVAMTIAEISAVGNVNAAVCATWRSSQLLDLISGSFKNPEQHKMTESLQPVNAIILNWIYIE
jgi:hypothetical protein